MLPRSERADVVIVGGGFVGLAAAAALANGRRRIVVFEAASQPARFYRGELLHPPAVDFLRRLDLWSPQGTLAVRGFAVGFDTRLAPFELPYSEIPGSGEGRSVVHSDQVDRLRARVADRPGVEIRPGRVTEVMKSGEAIVGAVTERGEEVHAPLTVVADGRYSRLRRRLGVRDRFRLLSFSATPVLETELPCPGYGHVLATPRGPVLGLGLETNQVRLCIDLPIGLAQGRDDLRLALRTLYAPNLPKAVGEALQRSLEHGLPDLCANHAVYTDRCAVPGAVLVGDAAGCSHPLTATGMMTGLHDVCALAEELEGRGARWAALARYQSRHYRYAQVRDTLAAAMYDLFCPGEDRRLLREGLRRYWAGSLRARAISMALLAGHESRLSRLLIEYVRVMIPAGNIVLGHKLRAGLDPSELIRLVLGQARAWDHRVGSR